MARPRQIHSSGDTILLVLLLLSLNLGQCSGFLHHNIIPNPIKTKINSDRSSSIISMNLKPQKLLVVGGGIGGLSAAFDAKHNLRPEDEVTVVSDKELFQFTPSNPWVALRKRTAEEISLSLPKILPRHGVNFVCGAATHLDPKKQQLTLIDGQVLDYDYPIIATGPRLGFDEIPGARTSSSLQCICTTPKASLTADAVDKLQEDPGPIVVGATQGASCFGPAYEFVFSLHKELWKRGGDKLVEQCPMTFVTSEPYIGHLGLKGAGDSKNILKGLLTKKGIEYYTNSKIAEVATDSVSIDTIESAESDPTGKSKHVKLPTKLTMLIPPFRGLPVWKSVPHLTDPNGLILVDDYQQSPEYPTIFGVGACVSIPPVDNTIVPTGAPKTGYLIESQGTAAIKNIRTMINHLEKHPDDEASTIEIRNRPLLNGLCITDFGDDGAIFLAMPQYGPRDMDVTLHGKPSILAKVAFEKYFLHKIETGDTDPYYEKWMLHLIGVDRVTSKLN